MKNNEVQKRLKTMADSPKCYDHNEDHLKNL